MRRQTALGDHAERATERRLDPFALPVSLTLPMAGRPPGAASSATIDRSAAVLSLPSGLETIPVRSYRGVAVRMAATEQGDLTVILELHHADPDLSVPLLVVSDPTEIAADWQAWSRALGLPMLLIEADGSVSRPVQTLGGIVPGTPKPRRMHSYFADRRPRFLARRKPGSRHGAGRLQADEIIARD